MKKNIQIGMIGAYGGQGHRILSYTYDNLEIRYIIYEHNVMKKREELPEIKYVITNRLDSLLNCDGIVIAAPTSEHFYYIDYFVEQGYRGYVFCEKPPVETMEELEWLKHIDCYQKKKMLFGFNLRYSIYQSVLKGNLGYDLGELRHCSVLSGHGLGYKDFYPYSWRNNKKKTARGIFETVSIHYLDLFINQFGKPETSSLFPTIKACNGTVWDNIMYSAMFTGGVTLNIFNSYVTPFINETKMIFENGILEINENKVKLYYPRDSFDEKGHFIMPPIAYQYDSATEIWEESQKEMMYIFYSKIIGKEEFAEEAFDRAVDTTEYILQIS